MSSTIAVVDDRESVAEAVALMLRTSGLGTPQVYESACRLIKDMEAGFRPAVVVTDFYMMEMNGVELLDTINALFGDIAGIIVTGYPEGVQSVSKFSRKYPVLCKGDKYFLKQLLLSVKHHLRSEETVPRSQFSPIIR